jgi:uncharacterized protein (TIGR02246 family)
MSKASSAVVLTLLLLTAASAYAKASDTTPVQAVLDKWIRAVETNDLRAVEEIMAKDKDAVWFGTDAAEHFVGWEPVRESIAKQFAAYQGTKFHLRDRAIKMSASGSVAWASEVIDWTTSTGGEAVSVPGIRVTTVLEKRQGAWLIVHFHYSVPVAGQAIKY